MNKVLKDSVPQPGENPGGGAPLVWFDSFDVALPFSWRARSVDLGRVIAGEQTANLYRDNYLAAEGTLDQLADRITKFCWGPMLWRGGKCLTANFIASHWMALDFDEADYSLAQAINEWSDTVALIGTTKSHAKVKKGSPAKDRFRIVVPWAEAITDPRTYKYNLQRLIRQYDADSACSDPGRFFWPCRDIVFLQKQGYLQPVVPVPVSPPRPAPARYRESGAIRRRTLIALRQPFPENEKNLLCFRCAKDMYDAGYSKEEIYSIIIDSPTYRGKSVSRELSDEIGKCIQSGINSVENGVAYGGSDGPGPGAQEETEKGGQFFSGGAVCSGSGEDA